MELDGVALPHWDLLRQRLAVSPQRTFKISWLSPGGQRREASFRQEVRSELDAYRQEEERLVFGPMNRPAWKTEAPVPVPHRFGKAFTTPFERTGHITPAI